jgi:dolichol kinase
MPILLHAIWATIIHKNENLRNDQIWHLPSLLRRTPLLPHLGWIVVGVGDSAAAIVGTQYGKHTWFHSKRTVEGSVAMLLSMTVAAICALQFMPSFVLTTATLTATDLLVPVLGTLVATTLMEAFTSQNDNLVLPIFACAFYMAIVHFQILSEL